MKRLTELKKTIPTKGSGAPILQPVHANKDGYIVWGVSLAILFFLRTPRSQPASCVHQHADVFRTTIAIAGGGDAVCLRHAGGGDGVNSSGSWEQDARDGGSGLHYGTIGGLKRGCMLISIARQKCSRGRARTRDLSNGISRTTRKRVCGGAGEAVSGRRSISRRGELRSSGLAMGAALTRLLINLECLITLRDTRGVDCRKSWSALPKSQPASCRGVGGSAVVEIPAGSYSCCASRWVTRPIARWSKES